MCVCVCVCVCVQTHKHREFTLVKKKEDKKRERAKQHLQRRKFVSENKLELDIYWHNSWNVKGPQTLSKQLPLDKPKETPEQAIYLQKTA